MPNKIRDLFLTIIGLGIMGFGFLFLDMDAQEIIDHYQEKLNEG